jgi:serine protease AprX
LIRNQRGTTAPDAPDYGVTWGGVPFQARRAMTVAAATLVVAGLAGPTAASAATTATASPAHQVSVIVRELDGAGTAPERAVSAFGGSVGRELGILGGFTAKVPSDRLDALRSVSGVASVTEDAGLALQSTDVASQAAQAGSLYTLANQVTGASAMWDAGYTGKGVDIAVVDSGVVPVDGLKGKVVHGPDLTAENNGATKNLDTYGHGTAMSSIIAGRDSAATTVSGNSSDFVGIAPDSRIVSIKIADAQGRADVSQAIAAIDWVVQNRNKGNFNIRVLNMSFGTDGVQSYLLDPLAYAAEQAWHKGIVVVVAVGNQGLNVAKVNNPASDPYLIAVGSDNANGTATTADDAISSFSNTGDGTRNPDLVAPGEKVVGLRAAGSYLDQTYPAARIGDRLFRGSGTSQAAAVVSGAAALLISQRPELTPDQVKALLTGSASAIPGATTAQQGAGLVNLAKAKDTATPVAAKQSFAVSTGLGSLELSRGSVHVKVGGREVRGEVDIRGRSFNASNVAAGLRNGTNWHGVTWSGVTWSGVTWSGVTWSGVTWSGVTWSGVTWSGVTWSGVTWSGVTWSGVTWSGVTWSGVTWSGVTWS